MYNFHSRNDAETISLIISNNEIEEIVDFNRESLGKNWLTFLIFENNPKLTLGYNNSPSRVLTDTTEFRKNGAKQFFGEMFQTVDLIFTNFSASLTNIFDMDRSKKEPWHWFSAPNELIIQGTFSDFPNLLAFETVTVIIRNIISMKETELLPDNFLTQVTLLQKLIIKNSQYVTIPKFYLENVYAHRITASCNLTLEIELTNIQQDSLTERNSSNLFKVNQVVVNNQMRTILGSGNNYSECSMFCMKNNAAVNECSALLESEKVACGICVKNIIGQQKLKQRLQEVCAIVEMNTEKTTENSNEMATLPSKTTDHIATTTDYKVKSKTLPYCKPHQ